MTTCAAIGQAATPGACDEIRLGLTDDQRAAHCGPCLAASFGQDAAWQPMADPVSLALAASERRVQRLQDQHLADLETLRRAHAADRARLLAQSASGQPAEVEALYDDLEWAAGRLSLLAAHLRLAHQRVADLERAMTCITQALSTARRQPGGQPLRNGPAIQRWLAGQGLTQQQVSQRLRVSPSILSETIRGLRHNRVVLDGLLALGCPEVILGLPVDRLFGAIPSTRGDAI